jgi:predicted nucleotidyltransferase
MYLAAVVGNGATDHSARSRLKTKAGISGDGPKRSLAGCTGEPHFGACGSVWQWYSGVMESNATYFQSRPSKRLSLHRAAVLELLEGYGVTNVQVFGSVARGEDTIDSDIDLLTDRPPMSFLQVARIGRELEELLGCRVDLVDYCQVPERSRERVFREARAL